MELIELPDKKDRTTFKVALDDVKSKKKNIRCCVIHWKFKKEMEVILKIWPIIKIILGTVFLLCCLTLPFLLIALGINKKKLDAYINQINTKGAIEEIKNINAGFDLFLAVNIFITCIAISLN